MTSSSHSAPAQPRVSVVIPTYNRRARCVRLLRMLADQTLDPSDFEVIVVDDCSTDDTSEALQALVAELPYRLHPMRAKANAGAGPARNLGWRSAAAPIIAFIDDDVVPDNKWLEEGLRSITSSPRVGVVQGRTNTADFQALGATRWSHTVIVNGPSPYFESCNIFYRREAIEAAGGFGVEYTWWSSPAWFEDTLAGWCAMAAGWETAYADGAVVTHDVEYRTMKWWIKTSLSQYREVAIAARFPEYRQRVFWRSWAPQKHDAAFVLGVVGLAAAAWWRPAALGVIPYAVWRRPKVTQGHFVRGCFETIAIDAARTAGHLYGAMRSHILVV